jgi:hypothetical protein
LQSMFPGTLDAREGLLVFEDEIVL